MIPTATYSSVDLGVGASRPAAHGYGSSDTYTRKSTYSQYTYGRAWLDAPAMARLPLTPLAAHAVDAPPSLSSPAAAGPYGFNIIDAPAAAVLSVNVTIHSRVELNTKVHSASRLPGCLKLFFPVSDDSSNPMSVC